MARPDKRRDRPEALWTVGQVRDYLKIPVATLYRWNHRGIGPRAYKVGRTLRYDPRDVWEWVQHHRD